MAYAFKYSLTIDHTKFLSGVTDYPLFFGGAYTGAGGEPDLRTVGNGGDVTDANGFDIAFFADENLTNPLDFELAQWDPAGSYVEFHVRVPSVSSSVDTVIYLAYGDAGISTFQGDVDGTWDANFKFVNHIPGLFNDSSGNGYTIAATGTSTVGGIPGAGTAFAGGTDSVVVDPFANISRPLTIEFWLSAADPAGPAVITMPTVGAAFVVYLRAADIFTSSLPSFAFFTAGGERGSIWTADGNFHHHAFVVDSSGDLTYYRDGSSQGITTITSGALDPSTTTAIQIGSGFGAPLVGTLDEIRFSDIDRSQAWILAGVYNQSDPSGFYSLTEIVATGPVIPIFMNQYRQRRN